jgi:hypothetical protein
LRGSAAIQVSFSQTYQLAFLGIVKRRHLTSSESDSAF